VQVKARAIPLPDHVAKFLESNAASIKQMLKQNKELNPDQLMSQSLSGQEFKEKLLEELKKAGDFWEKQIDYIWAFGPRRVGPNILLNHIPDYHASGHFRPVFEKLGNIKATSDVTITESTASNQNGDHAATPAENAEEKKKRKKKRTPPTRTTTLRLQRTTDRTRTASGLFPNKGP